MDDAFWKVREDSKQQLHERIQYMGGTSLASTCVNTFFALEGAAAWKPEKLLLREVSYVIDVGLVISMIGPSTLPSDYRKQVNCAVSAGTSVPPDLWSELLVAAFLKHHGASVEFVPRSASKTADLHCQWGGGPAFDVEVTRGKTRVLHASAQKGLADFVDALGPGDLDWHIVCFVSDASNNKILEAAFEAAVTVRPGERVEEPGLWSVVAVALSERDSIVGNRCNELFAPSWRRRDEPAFFNLASLLNGHGDPVIALRSSIPQASYMNPIKRKAEHGQHTAGRPYIIALDAAELPHASERLPADIEREFPLWTHVSGVLILNPSLYTTSRTKEFGFRLLANPHAEFSMPDELLELTCTAADVLRFDICAPTSRAG